MLPDANGIELMGQVPELADVPVIFISGYRRDETVAKEIEAGAVDYIVKPFSPTELVARVGAAIRRREEPEPFVVGDLAIDYAHRRVTVGGEAIDLTATEYELLRVLSLDAGRVVTFETLLRRVWAKPESAGVNLVRNFVRNLRRKLGESASSPAYLLNERGVGYRMAKPTNRRRQAPPNSAVPSGPGQRSRRGSRRVRARRSSLGGSAPSVGQVAGGPSCARPQPNPKRPQPAGAAGRSRLCSA